MLRRAAQGGKRSCTTQPAHSHIHDYEGHVEAVEADLEYWRTKRLEPRVLQLHRRGILTLYDLIRTAACLPAGPASAGDDARDLQGRIRALEDGLDDYVRGIGLVSLEIPGHPRSCPSAARSRCQVWPLPRRSHKH